MIELGDVFWAMVCAPFAIPMIFCVLCEKNKNNTQKTPRVLCILIGTILIFSSIISLNNWTCILGIIGIGAFLYGSIDLYINNTINK